MAGFTPQNSIAQSTSLTNQFGASPGVNAGDLIIFFLKNSGAATAGSISDGTSSYTGTLAAGPAAPSGPVSTAGIQIECSQWLDPASSALVTLQISLDNGVTWQPWCSAVFQGGSVDSNGNALTEAVLAGPCAIAIPTIQATIQVLSGTLVTQGISIMTGM